MRWVYVLGDVAAGFWIYRCGYIGAPHLQIFFTTFSDRFGESVGHTANKFPERLATKAWGMSGPVRIQEQNRTEQVSIYISVFEHLSRKTVKEFARNRFDDATAASRHGTKRVQPDAARSQQALELSHNVSYGKSMYSATRRE